MPRTPRASSIPPTTPARYRSKSLCTHPASVAVYAATGSCTPWHPNHPTLWCDCLVEIKGTRKGHSECRSCHCLMQMKGTLSRVRACCAPAHALSHTQMQEGKERGGEEGDTRGDKGKRSKTHSMKPSVLHHRAPCNMTSSRAPALPPAHSLVAWPAVVTCSVEPGEEEEKREGSRQEKREASRQWARPRK